MTIEDLLEECGGLGKYQFLLIFGISIHRLAGGWSMLQMSYAGFIPDWYCEVGQHTRGANYYNNKTMEKCSLNNSATGYQIQDCHSYKFEGDYRTVVNEWDLVCDRKWIKATMTSIQMVGVLVGAGLSGQLSDSIGRKKTLFGLSLYHSLINIAAAFSISWEMFAAFRFFIGIGIGGLVVVTFPYPSEFITLKWRPLIGVLPIWPLGAVVFSVAALFLNNWSHLHIACGLFGLPAMLTYIFVPESVRWLTTQGRYKEAKAVFAKMAQINGRTLPSHTQAVLEKIYAEEQVARSHGKKYSYWDLFNTKKMAKISIIFSFVWFVLCCVYYGISFGVSALAGNLFLNIFLLSIVELPALFSTFWLNNTFGRKWTCIGMFIVAAAAAFGCLVVQFALSVSDRDHWITAFSLIIKMCLGAAWGAIEVWTGEIYPTVVRSLGFGLLNSVARVGGILAPFVIDLDNNRVIAYIFITAVVVLAIVVILFVPETKGKILAESFDHEKPTQGENETKLATITTGSDGDPYKIDDVEGGCGDAYPAKGSSPDSEKKF